MTTISVIGLKSEKNLLFLIILTYVNQIISVLSVMLKNYSTVNTLSYVDYKKIKIENLVNNDNSHINSMQLEHENKLFFCFHVQYNIKQNMVIKATFYKLSNIIVTFLNGEKLCVHCIWQ